MREPIRLHVQNRSTQAETYQVTRERFDAAIARHADLGVAVEASIGADLEGFDAAIGAADVLVLPVPVPAEWRPRLYSLEDTAPKLAWVFQTGAGAEAIMPLDWLPRACVLTNNSGAHAEMAGEYAMLAVLMLNSRIPLYASVKEGRRDDRLFTTAIRGKTVVVVGLGGVGGAAARRLARDLGLHVIGVRAHPRSHPHAAEVVGAERLPEVLPRADFVLCAAPLTAATRGLIGAREIALMRPSAGLINMGRAPVVDYDALADALEAGRLAGAVLDVFEPEPLPADSRLWATPNLILTPHVGCDDAERYIPATLDVLFENLALWRAGAPLINVVDPAAGY